MSGNLDRMRRLAGHAWTLATAPLYRNAFLIMLANVLGSGLGFFFWLIVARFYATTDVGYAVTLIQTITFLATLAHLGMGTAIIRYLPESDDKVVLVNTAASLAGALTLALTAVFFVGVGVFVPELAFIQQSPIYPVVLLAAGLAIVLPAIYDAAGYAMRRADVLTFRTVSASVAKIPLALVFAAFVLTDGRLGVFLALAFATIASVVLEALILLPRVLPGFRPRPQLRLASIRPMFRFSLGNYAANSIASAGALLLPVLILILVPSGAAEVAYYYVATVVAGLLSIIPSGVFTSFYAEASQKNATNRARDERMAIYLSIALLIPGIAVLWAFSREMLTWFGNPAYAEGAVGPLRILIFGSLPSFINSILVTRVKIRKRSAPIVVGSIISTAVILSLGIVLLRESGIEGLALSAVIGSAAATPYYLIVARKSFRAETPPPGPGDSLQV